MSAAERFRLSEAGQWSGPLLALWWASQGNWERAHDVAQEDADPDGAWVHAYLHRLEGDAGNAAYWYRKAGRPVATGSLEQEWTDIVEMLLAQG